MMDRVTIEGRDGVFGAHIARPKAMPAPAVVDLHEVFGVNANMRKTAANWPNSNSSRLPPTYIGVRSLVSISALPHKPIGNAAFAFMRLITEMLVPRT